jgi:hypothetical protein
MFCAPEEQSQQQGEGGESKLPPDAERNVAEHIGEEDRLPG